MKASNGATIIRFLSFSQQRARKLTVEISQTSVQALIKFHRKYLQIRCRSTEFWTNNSTSPSPDCMSAFTQSYRHSCRPDSPLPQGFRSNASLQPDRWRRFHTLNSASESAHADVTATWRGKASPAMNEILRGTTAEYIFVPANAPASTRANSESVSNEIDESELQYKKQNEQRI
jgi:hypothetical protein